MTYKVPLIIPAPRAVGCDHRCETTGLEGNCGGVPCIQCLWKGIVVGEYRGEPVEYGADEPINDLTRNFIAIWNEEESKCLRHKY